MAHKISQHLHVPYQRNCISQSQASAKNQSYGSTRAHSFVKNPQKSDKADLTDYRFTSSLRNNKTLNVQTLAYQRYTAHPVLPAEEQANFANNYYVENCKSNVDVSNNIVNQTKQELLKQSAYILAHGAVESHLSFTQQRKNQLISGQQRARQAYFDFFCKKQQQKKKLAQQQKKWVLEYIRKVQKFIQHLQHTENTDDPNVKQDIFLRQTKGISVQTVKQTKIADPATALDILVNMRALLLKRKEALTDQRAQQQLNKTASMDVTQQSTSQNMSQTASFISVATNEGTDQQGGVQFAQKLCDFQTLKIKFGVLEVEKIRDILRRMIINTLVSRAQGHQMRQKKRQNDTAAMVKKQLKNLGHTEPIKRAKANNKAAKNSRSQKNNLLNESIPYYKDPLNVKDSAVKKALIQGGQFDTPGDIYTRNRNYSYLFKRKTDETSFNLSFRQQNTKEKIQPQTCITLR